MTLITTHIGRCTIIRDPGDPLPAWLGGGWPEEQWRIPSRPMPETEHSEKMLADGWKWNGLGWIKRVRGPSPITHMAVADQVPEICSSRFPQYDISTEFGEDITLPPTEDLA